MTFDPPQTELLSIIDISIEVFFISEICLNFFTSYVNSDGDEIRSKNSIAWNYLKTWFPIDAVSSIPTESITVIAAKMAEGSGDESGGTDVSALYNLRIIRIVRLTKLLRLLRLGKLIEVIEFSFPSLGTIIGLLRLLFLMVIVAHLQACVFYYLASLNTGNSWISKYHFDCCDENLNLYRAHELKEDPECYDASKLPPIEVLYTNAIYWSFATLTTVGYGDITPCNEMEILFSIASMVIGSAMFAYIVGNISSVVTNMKGQEIKLRQRLRELQEYITLRKIPKQMADVLRRQCMHRWKRTVFDEERVLEEFTPQMRRQVVNYINEDGLPQVLYFQPLLKSEQFADFTTELAMRIKPSSAQQGEDITKRGEFGGDLYIVQSGHVELKDYHGHRSYIHDKGCFNELELLHEFLIGRPIEYQNTAKAQSSCELLILRRQDFQDVWEAEVAGAESEEVPHPIRRMLVEQTKAAFWTLLVERSQRKGEPVRPLKFHLFPIAGSEDESTVLGISPEPTEAGPAGSFLAPDNNMAGVRRYKTDALNLEIPTEEAAGRASGDITRLSTATGPSEDSFRKGGAAYLPAESPARQAESSRGTLPWHSHEDEVMAMVEQIAKVVQTQAVMLERYVAASGIQEPAGIVRTVSNGSRDALAKRRKTKSLKESSSIITDVPFGLGVRPTSHF